MKWRVNQQQFIYLWELALDCNAVKSLTGQFPQSQWFDGLSSILGYQIPEDDMERFDKGINLILQ